MLTYQKLKKNPVRLLAATSLTADEFENLLPPFQAAYDKKYPADQTATGKPRQRAQGGGVKGQLQEPAERLLFILIYQKTNPLQQIHGLQFNLSQPQANYWIHRLLPVLPQALEDWGHQPLRDGSAVAFATTPTGGVPPLVIDGTERPRQRPKKEPAQKEHDSGKSQAHTDQNLLLVDAETTKVLYLSPTVPGKKHDKKMADEAHIQYPVNTVLAQDIGFQGYAPAGVVIQPPKKSRKAKS